MWQALALCVCLLTSGRSAFAQDGRPAVLVKGGPMYYLRDSSRTPMYMLPAGTRIQVVSRNGEWYHVIYHDPKWGDEKGYIPMADVQFQGPGLSEGSHGPSGPVTQRGFFEVRSFLFPQTAANDSSRVLVDGLFRQEVFVKPARWIQFAGGLDFRENSHDQVEDAWHVDYDDRSLLEPHVAVRRAMVTFRGGPLTVDAGKQFIRWGRADILNPTDRFAPRDYMNVINTEFLPVIGVRPSLRFGNETLEAVWVPQMTPSRLPLLNQRWATLPPTASGFALHDAGSTIPAGSEQGLRWNHSGSFEAALSFFDGWNHLPDINVQAGLGQTLEFARSYSRLRTYGADLAVPTPAFTLKSEVAQFLSPDSATEEYVLYVVELERQLGEWLFDGGYAGEMVTNSREGLSFGAERGVARSFIGRASYTVDPRKTVSVDGAVRRDGAGVYVRGEFSEGFGAYLRVSLAAVVIGGDAMDFLGQYSHNSHLAVTLRLSY